MDEAEAVDVLIVGAGLSGIGAACQLQQRCPDHTFAIVEARSSIGGTWDLFRYPGVRSDSDMFTLGYGFRPWQGTKAITDGSSILAYLRDTAREHDEERRIRLRHRVVRADWSGAEACWRVTLDADGTPSTIRCRFLFLCAGYYRYDRGHRPTFDGEAAFAGRIVHPQFWPDDLPVAGQHIVVIGSGATAMTLVPALAQQQAASVTMLQRSPTWVIPVPAEDPLARGLRRVLPARLAHGMVRWKQVMLGIGSYALARRQPRLAARLLHAGIRAHGLAQADIDAHFTPRYGPWEQRLCLLPDGDLLRAVRAGHARIVTDRIAHFEADGIRTQGGELLRADVVVCATGLELQLVGGIDVRLDGVPLQPSTLIHYKGVMLSGVPNLANTFGYTNSSWTLKSDLTATYVCRLLRHMRRTGARVAVPVPREPVERQPWMDFSSGYLRRDIDRFPSQGRRAPWRLNQNYLRDVVALRWQRVDDGILRFS